MMPLQFAHPNAADAAARKRLRVLCLGAHSDDIEIGCAGTLLSWLATYEQVDISWVVLSAQGERATEARKSARALMRRASQLRLFLGNFPDGQLPAHFSAAKTFLQDVRAACQGENEPDVVLTHRLEDRHQDHRLVAELSWQIWRRHLLLEYEIPKYEADLGQPALYVPLAPKVVQRKLRHLGTHFASQQSKPWFAASTFEALMTLRGLECQAPSGRAEAFQVRKWVLQA